MKVCEKEQIKRLAEFFKTLTLTNKTCSIRSLLDLQFRGLARRRDIIVDKWPDPKNVLIRSPGKHMMIENAKTRNSVSIWSCDLKNAAFLLKNEIDWSQKWLFEALVDDYSPLLEEISVSFGGVLHSFPNEYEARIALNGPLTNKFGSLPDNFQVSPLQTSDAAIIDSHYEFADEFSLGDTIYEIEHLPNVGIRDRNGALASWGLLQEDGTLGKKHTMPHYRKKGLGKFVALNLIEKTHNMGLIPLCTVDIKNKASRELFTSIGVSTLDGLLRWKMYTPPTAGKM